MHDVLSVQEQIQDAQYELETRILEAEESKAEHEVKVLGDGRRVETLEAELEELQGLCVLSKGLPLRGLYNLHSLHFPILSLRGTRRLGG